MSLTVFLAVIAIGIRLGSRGPVIFRQTRIGRDGQPFTIFKFRTMTSDAEACRDELVRRHQQAGLLFKIKDDPRVTPFGRWLRRWSLDELPQLANVVLGDMSLVGPRPALPQEALQYTGDVRRRLLVKPGLTGLWQVSGRSDLSWEQTVRLDLFYVDNWSLGFDFVLLWRTASAVLGKSGAY
jgi:lipopolysaccharide/colanic/teichoic acid biosynthesis glycosyltransferase